MQVYCVVWFNCYRFMPRLFGIFLETAGNGTRLLDSVGFMAIKAKEARLVPRDGEARWWCRRKLVGEERMQGATAVQSEWFLGYSSFPIRHLVARFLNIVPNRATVHKSVVVCHDDRSVGVCTHQRPTPPDLAAHTTPTTKFAQAGEVLHWACWWGCLPAKCHPSGYCIYT